MILSVSRVSPLLFAAHLTSSEELSDFQILVFPGFSDAIETSTVGSSLILKPNSSSALILL